MADGGPVVARIGVVTVSDRASKGVYEDRGGPAVRAELERLLATAFEPVARLVPDDPEQISKVLRELADEEACCLVVTTGGTGPAPRDVTPEATAEVCDKLLPGFGELMRAVSVGKVPTAILSRQCTGIRGSCLLMNLPGSPGAIRDCLGAVFPAVPDCLDLIGAPRLEVDPTQCKAHRPHEH